MPIYSDELNAYGPGNYYGRAPVPHPASQAPSNMGTIYSDELGYYGQPTGARPMSSAYGPGNMGTIYSDELGYYGQPTGARPMSSAPVEQPLTQGPYSYNPETQRLVQRVIASRTPLIDRMQMNANAAYNPRDNTSLQKKKNEFTPTDYAQFWKSWVEVPLYSPDLFASRINMPIRTEINTRLRDALTRRMLQYGNASNFNSDQLARYQEITCLA